ncbi:MAG: alpha/beta hydrolase fold domain-containing protein [Actinomycetota bacterium]|nr:alpha/beta hydrolase fold domain-containing protein [Actinomycetota bacterium]
MVVVHGGGWRSGNRGEFPRWNAWLADKGYVVFDIDYRLSHPPSWQDTPGDVGCAVGWVKENSGRYGVDPGRVALMGRSAGGHLALLTAYTEGASALPAGCEVRKEQDTAVAAVAAFYPPTDLTRLSALGYLGGIDRFLGGSRGMFPARYRLSSPVARVNPGDPPTFLVPGGDDEIVPPGESDLLAGGCVRPACPTASSGCPGPTTPSISSGAAGGRRSPAPPSKSSWATTSIPRPRGGTDLPDVATRERSNAAPAGRIRSAP